MNSKPIERRRFLGGVLGSIAAAIGWRPTGTSAAIAASVAPLRPVAAVAVRQPMDVTGAVRRWFVNRNPVLTRFPWVPTDEDELSLVSHRYVPQLGDAAHGGGGLMTAATVRSQTCQKFGFPVELDGTMQGPGEPLPDGYHSPFPVPMQCQLQNMIDDAETTMYYGVGGDGKAKGLRTILEASRIRRRYRGSIPVEFFGEAIAEATRGGGCPDVILVSTDCRKAECLGLKRIDAGYTETGTPIVAYGSDAVPATSVGSRLTFVECPLLRPGTAVAITSSEVVVRSRINPRWQLRESQGSSRAGDWECSLAIEVINDSHHCWAECTVEAA